MTLRKTIGFRFLASGTLLLASYYIYWRYRYSLNPDARWFAVPLLLAETYTFINSILFAVMMWKPACRVSPPPLENASVDIFITTYNENPDLVEKTLKAALRIDWEDKNVYVLDDGDRPAMHDLAEKYDCTVITRGEDWKDKPRHAKAGNVNNALMQTSGDFILILDADQIPSPQLVSRTIGYFRDPKIAFIQTPQHFYNIPPGDPFGSDAPLFYGPILQGKDGWNAAFFCGSNALLRREALLQLGIIEYSRTILARAKESIRNMHKQLLLFVPRTAVERALIKTLKAELRHAKKQLKRGRPVEDVFEKIRTAMQGTEYVQNTPENEYHRYLKEFCSSLDITRSDEAIPILPLSTSSVTEDMATSIRLHSIGWSSVFHHEILAQGLAPEDLGSALTQLLRWAQGTIQVLFRENPLTVKGLSLAQRIQYFTTIFSYFSGFAYLIFILSPIVYLFTGIAPVQAYSADFFWRLVPFLIFNRLMFKYISHGTKVRRGEQYAIALFPVWIKAVLSVLAGKNPRFMVTPKERRSGTYLGMVRIQILFCLLAVAAAIYALLTLFSGLRYDVSGLVINLGWTLYNIASLAVIIRAAVYIPPAGWDPRPSEALLGNTPA